MISVVYNDVLKSIDVLLDDNGVDLLIQALQKLKSKGGHTHLYATDDDKGVATWSPYKHENVFGELVLNILPSEAWEDSRIGE